jgi:hypothetical protein
MAIKTHSEYFFENIKNAIEQIFKSEAQRIQDDIVSKYTEEFNRRMDVVRKSAVIDAATLFEVTERSENITINFKMDQLNGK